MVLVDYAGGVDNLVAVLDLEPVEEGVPDVPVDGRLEDVGPVLFAQKALFWLMKWCILEVELKVISDLAPWTLA